MKRLLKEKHQLQDLSHHRLRYQVYCHEARFLNPDDYPSGLEIDEFDAFSEHFVAHSRERNKELIGTVRLIKWSKDLSFPTARHYESLLDDLARLHFPLHATAEISRLCISKLYRKRMRERLFGGSEFRQARHRSQNQPEVILELFKLMYRACNEELGITHWLASFEDCLLRLLERHKIRLGLLTPKEINYFGRVKIYAASIHDIEEELKAHNKELYRYFCDQAAVPTP